MTFDIGRSGERYFLSCRCDTASCKNAVKVALQGVFFQIQKPCNFIPIASVNENPFACVTFVIIVGS